MFQPDERIITEVVWHGEDAVEFICGCEHWAGANRRDFFVPDDDWESSIRTGSKIRYWTIQYSRVIGLEWWNPSAQTWEAVWVQGNDFGYKAERDARRKAYEDAANNAKDAISEAMNRGDAPETIYKMAQGLGLSGWQFEWAMHTSAISSARGPELMDWMRKEHGPAYRTGDYIRDIRSREKQKHETVK